MDTTSHRKIPHDRTVKVKVPAKRDTGELVKQNLKSMMDLRTKRARDIRGTMNAASNKVMGEEALDELSKETLRSYVERGVSDYESLSSAASKHRKRWDHHHKMGSRSEAEKAKKVAARFGKKADKRAKYLNKAEDKLREETELNELSKQTLRNYIHKSTLDMGKHERNVGKLGKNGYGSDSDRKAENRLSGITRAANKLAREETDLQELSKDTLNSYVKKASDHHDRLDRLNLFSQISNKGKRNLRNRTKGLSLAKKKLGKDSEKPVSDNYSSVGYRSVGYGSGSGPNFARNSLRSSGHRFADSIGGHSSNYRSYREETDLQELSKKTLASYVKKAADDSHAAGWHQGWIAKDADSSRNDPKKLDHLKVRGEKEVKIAKKRRSGIARALDKITKEETELNELSKNTLKSYVSKAMKDGDYKSRVAMAHKEKADKSRDANSAEYHNDHDSSIRYNKLSAKRYRGVARAKRKMNESYQDVKNIYKREVGEFMGQIRQAYEELIEHENAEMPQVYVDWKMIAGYAENLRDALMQCVPEEVEEAYSPDKKVKVSKQNYSWGKMVTVHDGNRNTFPLHPKHQKAISGLKHGDSVKFKDETGATVNAWRNKDHIHLKSDGSNKIVKVGAHHFAEATETTAAKLRRMGKSIESVSAYGKAKKDETISSLLMKYHSETDADRKRELFRKIKRMRA